MSSARARSPFLWLARDRKSTGGGVGTTQEEAWARHRRRRGHAAPNDTAEQALSEHLLLHSLSVPTAEIRSMGCPRQSPPKRITCRPGD
eukprot:SAG11_NODE_992_length_6262_cov_2.097193_4_plen_89_part_00